MQNSSPCPKAPEKSLEAAESWETSPSHSADASSPRCWHPGGIKWFHLRSFGAHFVFIRGNFQVLLEGGDDANFHEKHGRERQVDALFPVSPFPCPVTSPSLVSPLKNGIFAALQLCYGIWGILGKFLMEYTINICGLLLYWLHWDQPLCPTPHFGAEWIQNWVTLMEDPGFSNSEICILYCDSVFWDHPQKTRSLPSGDNSSGNS